MDCETMINIFNQCGGIMYCNYTNKQCVVKSTNLKCIISNNTDSQALDKLLWEQMIQNNVTINEKSKNDQISIIHRFQDLQAKSIIVNTLDKFYISS